MATGPVTQVADVVVPEIFTPYIRQLTEEKSRLVQAGVLVRNALMDSLLSGGGLTFNVPSWRDLCGVWLIRALICGGFFAVGCVALPRVVHATGGRPQVAPHKSSRLADD